MCQGELYRFYLENKCKVLLFACQLSLLLSTFVGYFPTSFAIQSYKYPSKCKLRFSHSYVIPRVVAEKKKKNTTKLH